ncbi:MAG: phosphatase PAP2 family protein [Verrucomicrobiia bacterium]
MNKTNEPCLLSHEIVFGLFLITVAISLIYKVGFFARDTLIFLGMLFVNVALISLCWKKETSTRWRLRFFFYPVAMNVSYMTLKTAVPVINPHLRDAFLQTIDQLILGGNASLWMEQFIHPWLTEFFSFCYLLFFPYLVISWVYYFFQRDLVLMEKFWIGCFTIYGIGFLGYLFVPALGPHLDPYLAKKFSVPLRGLIADFNTRVVLGGTNRVDCMPSLHCAVSSYLLFFVLSHRRWRFWLYLVPCLGLWISTIYLRYHYFIDLIFGFALTALVFWFMHCQTSSKRI